MTKWKPWRLHVARKYTWNRSWPLVNWAIWPMYTRPHWYAWWQDQISSKPPQGKNLSMQFFQLDLSCAGLFLVLSSSSLFLTLFFIFLSENSTSISRENCWFFWGEKLVKMLWFGTFLAVDNFDFTRKIVKKIMGEKLATMLGFCQNWIFLDKNLTFRLEKIGIDVLD